MAKVSGQRKIYEMINSRIISLLVKGERGGDKYGQKRELGGLQNDKGTSYDTNGIEKVRNQA